MTHRLPVRVYYEDTDLGGFVYYANYLKFIERGRSEWLRELGIDQVALKGQGILFVVRRVLADYLSPAFYDDQLTVETRLLRMTPVRVVMSQQVMRVDTTLFRAEVTLACIGPNGRSTPIPAPVAAALSEPSDPR